MPRDCAYELEIWARPVVSPYAHIDPQSCRAMWCNVISLAWEDALHPPARMHPYEVRRARDWFGSRDFHRVCQWAGVDADRVLAGFLVAIADTDRVKVGYRKGIAA